MTVDLNQLSQTLTYRATAAVPTILSDLEAIAELDKTIEAKQKRFTIILVAAIVIIFISFFLMAIAIGFFTLFIGIILAVFAGIMVQRYSGKNIPNYRYRLLQKILGMLERDMEADGTLQVDLVLSPPKDARKKVQTTPHPHRRGWKIDHYRDPWLRVQGTFLDGTEFVLDSTELYITQYGWKRSRSGKSKYKSKSKPKGFELGLVLDCSKRKYRALSVLRQDAEGAVQLPQSVRLKRLKTDEDRLYVMAKTPPWGDTEGGINSLYQTVTMMFLSLYQVLNLARKLSKTIEAQ